MGDSLPPNALHSGSIPMEYNTGLRAGLDQPRKCFQWVPLNKDTTELCQKYP